MFTKTNLMSKKSKKLGQGMTEYIIIVVLVAIVVLTAVQAFGTALEGRFTKASDDVKAMNPGSDAKSGSPKKNP